MKRFLAAQLIVLACLFHAATGFAQSIPFPGPGTPHTVSTYTGPGDVVSGATAWWGLRGYNGAYATGSNPAAVVCDTATFTTCTTINILSNGAFDTATAAGSSSCATACVIKSFTDQTGNGHTASCASAAVCATLTFNCINTSLPCAAFVKANNTDYSFTAIAVTTGFTLNTVINDTGTGTFQGLCCQGAGSAIAWGFTSTVNTGYMNNGGTNQTYTISAGANHSTSAIYNGASSLAVVDVTATSVSPGTTGGNITDIGRISGLTMTAKLMEFGVWNGTIFNSTQYGNMCHNQFSFWATAVSC